MSGSIPAASATADLFVCRRHGAILPAAPPTAYPHYPRIPCLRAGPGARRAARFLQAQRLPGQLGARGGPREAWARLERLRKGYARDVRELRRQYAYEVQLMEAERQRKAEARAEAARVANEERKAAKAAAAQTRAAERRAFEQDFRLALMKERAEKLESWREKEKLKEQKKAEQRELLRKKSGIWVAEDKLEEKILDAIVHTTPL